MTPFSVPGAEIDRELSDEGGQPVVQLHGLTSSRTRDRLLALDLGLGLSGTRLLRYDARGHGRSTGRPVAGDYAWPVLATDLLHLLEDVFPGEAVYGVGTSMGAGTLLHAALREPDRFRGLTLLLPPTAWQSRQDKAQDYLRAAELIEQHGIETYLRASRVVEPPPASLQPDDSMVEVAPDLLPWVFRGAAQSDLPSEAQLRYLSVPTTVLAWTDDPAHPLSTAQRLTEALPAGRMLQVADCPEDVGRWPQMLHETIGAIPSSGEAASPQVLSPRPR